MSSLTAIKQTANDIQTITIQWATNIAREGIKSLGNEIANQHFDTLSEFDSFLYQAIDLLRHARETEPMLFNGLRLCKKQYEKLRKQKATLITVQQNLAQTCQDYVAEIEKEESIRPQIGAELIQSGYTIVTHCHSGSVIKILATARDQGKKIHVYNTETRPLYQGRKTSNDLVKAGVPDTMITDDMAPFFIDNVYESHVHIDMVILGCDAIKLDGSIYNKVGSFSIALAAWHSKIPVYIVGSITKIDIDDNIHIEIRDGKEIRDNAPQWLQILNYAFDMVPAKFITGIITEYGVISPKDIKKYKKYLWV